MAVQIRRLLCPIDFSDASEHAVAHAVALARAYKGSITALHVHSGLLMSVPDLGGPTELSPDRELEHLRSEAASCFAGAEDVPLDVVIEEGQPARHILRRAAESNPDVIVMGTHGLSGFERLMLGSVTERVLRHATAPVLTVPPRSQATSKLPFQRLLCPVDFSESSLAALELAASIADQADAALTVMHAVEWPWPEPPPPVLSELPPEQAKALADCRRYLETGAATRLAELASESAGGSGRISTRVVHGKSYTEILRVAASDRADLIVMGVHGRNAADVMLFGSTTNQVVRRATCPVLTLRR